MICAYFPPDSDHTTFSLKKAISWIEPIYFSQKQWFKVKNVLMILLGVDYLWIIVMFLSSVWTLVLTAPIHCRGSIGEQVMQCCISHSPYTIESSTLHILEDYIRMQSNKNNLCFPIFLVYSVSNHFNIMLPYCQCRQWTATRLTRLHNRALVILNRVWRTPGFLMHDIAVSLVNLWLRGEQCVLWSMSAAFWNSGPVLSHANKLM